jgi:cell division protein FtsB
MLYRTFAHNKGLIRTIVLVVIALLILSYFGFNLRNLVDSPNTQDNFNVAISFVIDVWNDYLKTPAMYLWNDIFLKLIWKPAIEILQNRTGN